MSREFYWGPTLCDERRYKKKKKKKRRNNMSVELKPCPFCGNPDIIEQGETEYAQCYCTALDGRSIYEHYWNTRPIEDTLRKQFAEQKMMYEVIEQKLNDTCDTVALQKSELARKDKEIVALDILCHCLEIIVEKIPNRTFGTLETARARLAKIREEQ